MLAEDFQSLGDSVDPTEAQEFAKEAVNYPRHLAKTYRHCGNHIMQNILVNIKVKPRGLCYHWVEDTYKHFQKFSWDSFDLYWAVSDKGEVLAEHNCVLVTAAGEPFKTGIILDPWMKAGNLTWYKLKTSDYDWQLRYRLPK